MLTMGRPQSIADVSFIAIIPNTVRDTTIYQPVLALPILSGVPLLFRLHVFRLNTTPSQPRTVMMATARVIALRVGEVWLS